MRMEDIGRVLSNQVQSITEQAQSRVGQTGGGSSRLDTFAQSLSQELQSQINTYSPQAVTRPDGAASAAASNTALTGPTNIALPNQSGASGTNVGDEIKSTINQVNSLQHNADDLSAKVATGSVEDTHKAMIAMERALMSLDFTLQVRNKVLDAYQEIMRTQV